MPNIPEVKIGGTTYKLKDTDLRNNIVLAQNTQPTNENNRIWLQENSEERQVPTWEEFSGVKSALTDEVGYIPVSPWKSGSMTSTTGKVQSSTTKVITDFIPVVPGKEIVVNKMGTNQNIDVFEFETNVASSDSVNVRLVRTICYPEVKKIKLTSQTNFIRLQNPNSIAEAKYNAIYYASSAVLDDAKSEIYPMYQLDPNAFSNRNYVIGTGWSTNNSYISNNSPLKYDVPVTISANTGYEFLILYADEEGNVTKLNDYAWRTKPIAIKEHVYFYITIRKIPSSTISIVVLPAAITITAKNIVDIAVSSADAVSNTGIPDGDKYLLSKDQIASAQGFFIQRSDAGGRVYKLINPYAKQYSNQYMGQLHDHSWTVENRETQHTKENAVNVYQNYKKMGYDFITITNYTYFDDITPCPVENDSDIIWFCNSFEQAITPTITDTAQYTHFICLNADHVYSQETVRDGTLPNTVLEALLDDDVIVTLAHPMWYSTASSQTQYSKTQLLALSRRLKFVEIYNSYSQSENESPYTTNSAYALDVLASDDRIVWGVAVSDSHDLRSGLTMANFQGNIKVFAPTKTRSAIWESYLSGNFYCCEKVENRLNSVVIENNMLVVDIGDPDATTKFIGNNATTLATKTGSVVEYKIAGTEKYVRAEITLGNGTRIWTNPVYITNQLIEYPQ